MKLPNNNTEKFLVIQTASIGDVILMTPVIESLNYSFPDATIDIIVKQGNQSLFHEHPYLRNIYTWDKEKGKYGNLFRLFRTIRKENYDYVFNLQRFFSSGLLTALSGAKIRVGFSKNPLSFLFSKAYPHEIKEKYHEVDRNLSLLGFMHVKIRKFPRLYPSNSDLRAVNSVVKKPYLSIAPASLWFTKQFPVDKWIEFINKIPQNYHIYIIGSEFDFNLAETIKKGAHHSKVVNMAGKLTLLETAALCKGAVMNYTNDSAPQHIASAVNAPVTSVFCSTIPGFGFGPLSKNAAVVQTNQNLKCRPCGLHGKNNCPEKHFNCAKTISPQQLLKRLP